MVDHSIPKSPLEVVKELEAAEAFDARCGTNTRLEPPRESPPGWHLPISVGAFTAAMKAVDVRHEEFVFVDIGSGKGRGVMLASEYPFRRCIGVEIDPEWDAIAIQNFALWHSPAQRCKKLETACADALEFAYPKEDLFVFFYNATGRDTLAALLDVLKRDVEAHPRRIVFVYAVQQHDDVVGASGWLHRWGEQGDVVHPWGPKGRSPNAPYPMFEGKFPFAVYSSF